MVLASGEYEGPIIINKPITIRAEDGGTVTLMNRTEQAAVTIAADRVALVGLTIHDVRLKEQPSISIVKSDEALLHKLHIRTGSYGIRATDSNHMTIREALIEWGIPEEERKVKLSQKGNGIDLYHSHDNRLLQNTILSMHDGIYMENSDRNVVEDNRFERLRYGVHCMYTADALIRGNTGQYNITGAMIMAVRGAEVSDNQFTRQNENVNSQGILLFDAHDSVVQNNEVAGNRVGLYVEQSTGNLIAGNQVLGNFIGLQLLKAENNEMTDNVFAGNVVQAEARQSTSNTLVSNYWDSFQGIDADGDGQSDLQYAISPLFQSIVKAKPVFQLFFQSPSFVFLEGLYQSDRGSWTADSGPLMKPSLSRAGGQAMQTGTNLMTAAAGLLLLLIAISILLLMGVRKP